MAAEISHNAETSGQPLFSDAEEYLIVQMIESSMLPTRGERIAAAADIAAVIGDRYMAPLLWAEAVRRKANELGEGTAVFVCGSERELTADTATQLMGMIEEVRVDTEEEQLPRHLRGKTIPPMTGRQLVKALNKLGFDEVEIGSSSDHVKLYNQTTDCSCTVGTHSRKKHSLAYITNKLRTAHVSRADFLGVLFG